MKILNLLSFVFLIVLGSSGRVQDTREEVKDKRIAHLERHVKSLQKDSVSHAVLKPIHDTIVNVHDSIIIQKKTIEIPVTIPLTGQDSDRIAIKEFPKLYDSLAKHKGEIIVTEGLKGNHDK